MTRELTVISEGSSSTNVSLSDLTDPSTPKDRHSFISSCSGSASAARLSKISLSSLGTFWSPETVSNEEAEILSLYSGEISPCSTMERPPSKINHSFPLAVDSSISSVSDRASMKQLSKSVQQLSVVGGKTGLSSKLWFKSESNIASKSHKASRNSKEKKKKIGSHKPTPGKSSFQSILEWVNRRRKSSNPSVKSSAQKQQEASVVEQEPAQLLVHELDEEPVTTPARLFYFSLAEDSKTLPAASPNDGTSLASIEWQPLEPKSTVTPSTSGEMSTLVKVNFEDQSQSSISLSQSGSQETILSNEFNRSDPNRSSLSTMSSATNSLHRMSRVGSPSNSSGYHSESRQSSQLSLNHSESFGTRYQLLPEYQYYDIVGSSTYKPVKRHRSMNSHSQHTIHDASPLVRARSNSMHK